MNEKTGLLVKTGQIQGIELLEYFLKGHRGRKRGDDGRQNCIEGSEGEHAIEVGEIGVGCQTFNVVIIPEAACGATEDQQEVGNIMGMTLTVCIARLLCR